MGLIFLGLTLFKVGKSIFSKHRGINTKKVPFCGLHVPFRGTLMRARRVTHTPTRHQTLPWGSIGVAFKGFRTDGDPFGARWHDSGAQPEHPPPPRHRHDVARHVRRTLSKQQIGLLRSNLVRGWTDPAGWCSLDRRKTFC